MSARKGTASKGAVRRPGPKVPKHDITPDELWEWRILQRKKNPDAEPGETRPDWRYLPWTQADAALWYGVHVRTWRRWENGEVPMPTPLITRILEDRP